MLIKKKEGKLTSKTNRRKTESEVLNLRQLEISFKGKKRLKGGKKKESGKQKSIPQNCCESA